MSDYENLQCAASTVVCGDGQSRGTDGIAASIDRLTFVIGIAVRQRLTVGSDQADGITEVLEDIADRLGPVALGAVRKVRT